MDDYRAQPAEPKLLAGDGFREVLVVDDSRAQRMVLAVNLRRWGFTVTEAESGDEALALCQARDFDLILSDWMMPGLTGPEFCAAFRALPEAQYCYFILVTSKSDKVDIVEGLEIGADDFLTKPVNTAELRARIQAGGRIVGMEREMAAKNAFVAQTLEEIQTLYDGLERDLREARTLQQSLVPDRTRRYGASEVAFLLQPCGHIGGDLVGSFAVGARRVGIYSVDVAGHGVASALMTARIAGQFVGSRPERNLALKLDADGALQMRPPAEVFALLNAAILEEVDTELYFTMVLAEIDLETGVVDMAFAGHPGPLVQGRDGTVRVIASEGMPIGLIDGASFGEAQITLAPGERLMLYSDGMSECENSAGDQLEETGLAAFLETYRARTGIEVLETMAADLRDYTGGKDMADDVSGLIFDYRPGD